MHKNIFIIILLSFSFKNSFHFASPLNVNGNFIIYVTSWLAQNIDLAIEGLSLKYFDKWYFRTMLSWLNLWTIAHFTSAVFVNIFHVELEMIKSFFVSKKGKLSVSQGRQGMLLQWCWIIWFLTEAGGWKVNKISNIILISLFSVSQN